MKILGLILMVLVSSDSFSGDLYHCKQSNGVMSYQDKPCLHETIKISKTNKNISKPTEKEVEKGTAIMMGLMGKGIDGLTAYKMKNSGKAPKGCFDLNKKLHKYGKDITVDGVKFRCMKMVNFGMTSGAFHLVKMHSYCKNNPSDNDCEGLDPELKNQIYRQL